MTFKVIWPHRVRDVAAELCLRARLDGMADLFTSALARLETALSVNPQGMGESRPDSRRIACAMPLPLYFEVLEDEAIVLVHDIHYALPLGGTDDD